eukprot:6196217-Pleurochrysis_carterae.AAC.1
MAACACACIDFHGQRAREHALSRATASASARVRGREHMRVRLLPRLATYLLLAGTGLKLRNCATIDTGARIHPRLARSL